MLGLAAVGIAIAAVALWHLESNFLPPFNEETSPVNILLPPSASLPMSRQAAEKVH